MSIALNLMEVKVDCQSSSIPPHQIRRKTREQTEHDEPGASLADPRRPLPAKDPRVLRALGGALRPDDPLYIRREADARIDASAASTGETLVIKGARQMGKSSLLVRYLEACHEAGKRFAFVDFQSFSERDLTDYGALLSGLAGCLLRALRLPAPQIPPLSSQLDFTYFIEDAILAQIAAPVAFALDEVDRVLGSPISGTSSPCCACGTTTARSRSPSGRKSIWPWLSPPSPIC